jgi:vitamin B12 transporter
MAFGHSITSVDITYFYANLTDEIQTVFDESTFLSTVVNLDGESRRHGLELALRAQPLKRWHLTAGYTYTDSRQADGRPELRRPRHIASLNNLFELARGRARIHVGVDYSGKQSDAEFVWATPSDRVVLDGFTLIKIAGDYEIADGIRLYGRIENVRNERYEEVFSYRGRSRSATLGVAIELGE